VEVQLGSPSSSKLARNFSFCLPNVLTVFYLPLQSLLLNILQLDASLTLKLHACLTTLLQTSITSTEIPQTPTQLPLNPTNSKTFSNAHSSKPLHKVVGVEQPRSLNLSTVLQENFPLTQKHSLQFLFSSPHPKTTCHSHLFHAALVFTSPPSSLQPLKISFV
jgi:hypothetical protein